MASVVLITNVTQCAHVFVFNECPHISHATSVAHGGRDDSWLSHLVFAFIWHCFVYLFVHIKSNKTNIYTKKNALFSLN